MQMIQADLLGTTALSGTCPEGLRQQLLEVAASFLHLAPQLLLGHQLIIRSECDHAQIIGRADDDRHHPWVWISPEHLQEACVKAQKSWPFMEYLLLIWNAQVYICDSYATFS